jgi:hypothetical protein
MRRRPGELRLQRAELLAVGGDHPRGVDHHDVLPARAEGDVEARGGDRRRARAAEDDLQLIEVLLDELDGVQQRRARDDRGAVLVVVEDGDVHALAQRVLDREARGCADVLEVDAAEGGLHRRDRLDERVGVVEVELDVEHVDVGEPLEQHALALHHRLRCTGTDVAETQHRGAVGDDADEVALRGVVEHHLGVLGDVQTRRGHARRVRQREVALGVRRLRRRDRQLARGSARWYARDSSYTSMSTLWDHPAKGCLSMPVSTDVDAAHTTA